MMYLIKSSLCLLFIYLFYALLLEKEKMHQFKRWYLLIGLGISFLIPMIPLNVIGDFLAKPITTQSEPWLLTTVEHLATNPTVVPMTWQDVILSVYLLVTLLFLLRFIYNIARIITSIYKNEIESFLRYTLVLLPKASVPFTFLRYIFVNKEQHQNHSLSPAIYQHECIHAEQLHSLDVILAELLRSIFWFNPILWMYKKSIQLNHEFIADQATTQLHDPIKYQKLLLNQIRPLNHNLSLTSNLSFIHTKKRLNMITKPFSPRKRSFYLALTLPLMVGLSLLFGNYTHAQKSAVEGQQSAMTKAQYYEQALFATEHESGGYQLRHFVSLSKTEKELLPFPGNARKPLAERTMVYYEEQSNRWEIHHGEFGPEPPPAPKPPAAPSFPKPDLPPPPPPPPSVTKETQISPVAAPTPPKAAISESAKSPTVPSAPKLPEQPSMNTPQEVSPPPPLPPPPPHNLNVDELVKKGAIFYKDGKRIGTEEAKQLIQTKKSFRSLHVNDNDGKIIVAFKTSK